VETTFTYCSSQFQSFKPFNRFAPFKAFQATAGSKRSKVPVAPIVPLRLHNQKQEMSKTLAEFHIARGTNTSIGAVRTQSLVLRFIPVDV
jgi:hypothetical protein